MQSSSHKDRENFRQAVSNMNSLRKACKDATLEQLKEGEKNLSNIISKRQRQEESESKARKSIPVNAKYKYYDAFGHTHYWDGEGDIPMEIQRRIAIGEKLEDFLLKE